MDRNKIIEIAIDRGLVEVACRGCGSVSNISDTIIVHEGKRIRCSCPDCGTFMRWLPFSKFEKIYWKGTYDEVGSFDSSILMWMLSKNYSGIRKPEVRKAVEEELARRMDAGGSQEVKDFNDAAEQARIDQENELKGQIKKIDARVAWLTKNMLENQAKWDYYEAEEFKTKMKYYKRSKAKLEKQLEDFG